MKCKFGSQLAVMICAIKTTERQHRAAARVCKCTQTHMHSTYAYIHMHTLTYLYNYINYIYVLYCFVLFVRTEFFKSFYLFSFVIFISLFTFFFQWNVSFIMLTSKSRASPCHLLSSTYLKFIQ